MSEWPHLEYSIAEAAGAFLREGGKRVTRIEVSYEGFDEIADRLAAKIETDDFGSFINIHSAHGTLKTYPSEYGTNKEIKIVGES